jgi:hypothetical protein
VRLTVAELVTWWLKVGGVCVDPELPLHAVMHAAVTSNRVPSRAVNQRGLDDVFFRGQAKGRSRMGSSAIAVAAPGSVSVKTTVTV